MTGLEALGGIMLLVMLGAIFIGIPLSLTLLCRALIFGFMGMGDRVFDLAYFQTIGLMKQDEFVAVPMFILMGYICDDAGIMERMFKAFRDLLTLGRAGGWRGAAARCASLSCSPLPGSAWPPERSAPRWRCSASWPAR